MKHVFNELICKLAYKDIMLFRESLLYKISKKRTILGLMFMPPIINAVFTKLMHV